METIFSLWISSRSNVFCIEEETLDIRGFWFCEMSAIYQFHLIFWFSQCSVVSRGYTNFVFIKCTIVQFSLNCFMWIAKKEMKHILTKFFFRKAVLFILAPESIWFSWFSDSPSSCFTPTAFFILILMFYFLFLSNPILRLLNKSL